jgi:ribosomal-protein-serine acetyltransferase
MFTLKVDKDIELQLFQLHHAEELFRLVDHNRQHLRKWLPWVDEVTSPLHFHYIIPIWLRQFAENNGFDLGIRYKKKLVGNIGLHNIDWFNRQTSIGYFLAKKTEGRGIMTKSTRYLVNYAFSVLKLNRVEIRCGENNRKSRAIPERLGFTKEGIIRQGENLNGYFHNLIVYSMLAQDWRGKQ